MKIKCLLIKSDEKVKVQRIPANIKFIKSIIGERLIKIQLDKDTILLANKDVRKIDFNRIYKNEVINGTFLIVGVKDDKRVSLKKRQIRKYSNFFKLSKHQKRINEYKDELINQYYFDLSMFKKGKHGYEKEYTINQKVA